MANKKQYYIEDVGVNSSCFVLFGSWSSKFADLIERENINYLRLSLSNGWEEEDLNFLDEVPSIVTGFEIFSWKITDLEPIMRRKGIEHLSFQVELKQTLDLSVFSNTLKTLKLYYSSKVKNIEKCYSLEHLNIVGYPDINLNRLEHLKKLKRLQIASKKLTNVDGIQNLAKLRSVDFFNCPNLTNLNGLATLQDLEEIELDNCNSIDSVPSLSNLSRLESVIIQDCGVIKNLKFLTGLKSLERVIIIGKTEIEDKDLKPLGTLSRLKDVRVPDGDNNLSRDEVK